jgi:hypothetical protein
MDMPKTYFKVQKCEACQRTVSSEHDAIWELVPREVNVNILKFLNGKELFRFRMVSKSAKIAVMS